jgi:FkbM family methyltransferase
MRKEFATASPLKLWVAKVVAGNLACHVIGILSGKRIRHQGLWLDARSSDFSPRVRAQMFWGIYEGAETRMIRSLLRDSTTVVELGSSLGITTAHIATVMSPGDRVICVEANPQLVPGLMRGCLDALRPFRLEVIHAAVADHCGTTVLAMSPETGSSRVAVPRLHESAVEVPALTLKEILHRAGVAEFDLVADIEGAEATFLLRDPDVLAGCQRAVIELHESVVGSGKVRISDLLAAAIGAGFQIVSRRGPGRRPEPSLMSGRRPVLL